ncbi:MAG: TolC family protein [Longimicrobiaceae bacterium]
MAGPVPLPAQQTLSLEEAIRLARAHNPDFQARANDRVPAWWGVRAAYGNLFLPSASASLGFGYTAEGEPRFGSVAFGDQPAFHSSSYRLGLTYRLDGSVLLEPARARAEERAVVAGIESAAAELDASVTSAYLDALQAEAALAQAVGDLERTSEHARLASARFEAGLATSLDVRRSEVQHGQAEVRALQVEARATSSRLDLGLILGTPLPQGVRFTSDFPLFEPAWSAAELQLRAQERNPGLSAARARLAAAEALHKVARSQYLPSLTLSVGWTGSVYQAGDIDPLVAEQLAALQGSYAQCQQQNRLRELLGEPPAPCVNPEDPLVEQDVRRQLAARNSGFPFDYQRQPLSADLTVSLPIFTGFSRERQIAEARVAAEDAGYAARSRELELQTGVEDALLVLETAYHAARLQREVREMAEDELRMAGERFRAGVASSIEVTDAQANLSQAERDEITARYDFHKALAALEILLGEPLR